MIAIIAILIALLLPAVQQAREAAWSPLSQFICPSDGSPTIYNNVFGLSNYLLVAGNNIYCRHANVTSLPACCGIFYACSRVRIRDVRDGPSNTLAFGEGVPYISGDPFEHIWASGFDWRNRNMRAASATYRLNPTANNGNCLGSRHEGGAFFSLVDGSVRFLSENIDAGVYAALATIGNNEVIDDEDY